MPNRFETRGANFQPLLEGVSRIGTEYRQGQRQKDFSQRVSKALDTGDAQELESLRAEYPNLSKGINEMIGFRSDQTKQAYGGALASTLDSLEREQIQRADETGAPMVDDLGSPMYDQSADMETLGMVEQAMERISSLGGDPRHLDAIRTNIQEGDYDGAMRSAKSAMMFTHPEEYVSRYGATKDDTDFLKEERKNASQDVRAFDTKVRALRGSYEKLSGLSDEAKAGNRGARNAMVVTLARLISPGIVTETEASALSGGQTTMQAVIQKLTGKDVELDAILRGLDPYGETFDAEGLLRTGESVVASGRQPLIDMYDRSLKRATDSGMSARALKTNFGTNKNYDYLSSFEAPDRGEYVSPADTSQPAPAPTALAPEDVEAVDWANANPNDPRSAEILKRVEAKQGGM